MSNTPELAAVKPEPKDKTDQAALMGTALAAIFATVVDPGAYTTFDVVAGAALSFVLLGYYRPPAASGWEAARKAMAFGGAVALLGNLLLSYFVQQLYVHRPASLKCDGAGDVAECVADAITVKTMPIVTAVLFGLAVLAGWLLIRRAMRRG